MSRSVVDEKHRGEIIGRWLRGEAVPEVAQALGIEIDTVNRVVNAYGADNLGPRVPASEIPYDELLKDCGEDER